MVCQSFVARTFALWPHVGARLGRNSVSVENLKIARIGGRLDLTLRVPSYRDSRPCRCSSSGAALFFRYSDFLPTNSQNYRFLSRIRKSSETKATQQKGLR